MMDNEENKMGNCHWVLWSGRVFKGSTEQFEKLRSVDSGLSFHEAQNRIHRLFIYYANSIINIAFFGV